MSFGGKTVCVVGAGLSGVASLKECVAQGLKPTCFELDSDMGGVWKTRDAHVSTNCVSLWPNFITNTSKWANSFSDFPPDPKDPPYQTQEGMFQYYRRYAKHFNLFQHIQFNTRVIWIRRAPDHEMTGRWEVFTCPSSEFRGGDKRSPTPDTRVGDEEMDQLLAKCKKETFDFVLICSGYFKFPFYPKVTGSDAFKGIIHHSFNYTSNKMFEGKTVLVVGNKFSALDIADDVGAVSKQTYLAVGEGTWIVPRVHPGGRTIEQTITRDLIYDRNSMRKWSEYIVSAAQNRLDHKALGIVPSQEPCLAPRGLGDGLAVKIMSGRVKLFGRLTKFTTNEAHFKDGNVIKDLDAVIYCTGYGADLSFLDAEIIAPNGKMELYKMVFPVREEHHTLALIGVLGCDSPMAIVCEMQARLASRVMAKRHRLPDRKEMEGDANHWNEMNWQLKRSYRYFLPGFVLMDSIASCLGVYPSFWKLLFRDPVLAFRVWYGSIVGAHYRLLGSDNHWEAARKFTHHQYEERAKCLRHINAIESISVEKVSLNNSFSQWLKIISFGAATCALAFVISQRNVSEMLGDFNVYRA